MLPILIASLALDLVMGEPPTFIHPVVYVGRISEKLIRPFKGKVYGVILWLASVIPVLLLCLTPLYLPRLIEAILLVLVLKTTFSIRMLYMIVRSSIPLREESRRIVQNIVRRDLREVSLGHVASASIESLFESLVDGITSPLFWFLLLGLPGALLQRFANTMDSMVGYKTPDLINEGYFSARMDTALNYVPARLTGLMMLLAGLLLGLNVRNAIVTLRNTKMESPNARYPIAIAAGLLEVRLEKINAYSAGSGNLPDSRDVERALALFRLTLLLYLLFILTSYYYLYGVSLFGYPYGLVELL
ncbi:MULTISPECIES: cobalamin biosynthesis protein [Metallosphaera]|uniref:Probable cobalamin biosynthesis protein CobD n=3 Tax=Metallosphaera TaxID=41980 RepID=A4YD72_METS5|nr:MULTISPECIES: cobalamin biosynthesis protein [Metallosphaera]ABP94374.1 adenosylcobinamide-phosphate synthase [Metallosphaera sedula DSM 5348]AIM26361.1 adenosylcobinamide-phosphate synthase [Metallosphaera sedula]AKV73370.1 cobalamin biosynthesis protein CobD [Metallosphaera sedula]AKV75614.1 cobalamin biosynthesis protein CobD [Metallosphaera sedula]AKV77860.1 cobalamin biosynthesis protein CobD [Metallosphaera sedula]